MCPFQYIISSIITAPINVTLNEYKNTMCYFFIKTIKINVYVYISYLLNET